MRVGVLEDPLFLKHDNGPGHPERPERLIAIGTAVRTLPFFPDLVLMSSRDALRTHLELVHEAVYLDRLEETRDRELTVFDADTSANEWSHAAALRAAGSAVYAVQQSLDGTVPRSFVAARPPGHHAGAGYAMGFCLLNSAAVAAAAAISGAGLERVAIVDWDVHHGNGTADIFCSRRDVLYVSLHQHPLYPGTGQVHEVGSGEGTGFTVNIPLPGGCTDADYRLAMDTIAAPILRQYRPQLIIVSAGFDAHADDPLAGMLLTTGGFASLTRTLVRIAGESASGRIVHLLEGGYDLDGLAQSTCAVLSVLTDATSAPSDADPADGAAPSASAGNAVRIAAAQHAEYWSIPAKR
jgi:acetoin utilization deacetylase AcuC-like enzyme